MTDATISSISPEQRSAVTGLAPMVAIVFFGFLTVGAPLPVLSLYIHDHLGFSGFTVGWVIGIQSLVTILSRHRAGTLSDQRGPKFAVLLGLPLAAASGLLYLCADFLAGRPIPALAVLVFGRLLLGAAESLFVTGAMSWGIGRIGAARTGRVMSWQGIALYSALGAGAPFGLAVYSLFGFGGVAVFAIASPLVALAIAAALPAVRALGGERVPFHHVLKLIWRPGTVLMLATVPFAGMAAFLPLDYAAEGWSGAGVAMALFGFSYVVVRLIGTQWTDRFGAARVVSLSLAVELAGQFLLWLAPVGWLATAGAGLTGAGFSLIFPAMGVVATRRLPAHQRGQAVGNFMAFFDLAIALAGPLAGLAAGVFGYSSTFLVGGIAVIGSLLLLRSAAASRG